MTISHIAFCLGLSLFSANLLARGYETSSPARPTTAARSTPMAEASEPGSTSTLVTTADGRRLATDIARIVNRGELVVAMVATEAPPFFYMKNGELVGIDVDLAKALARELSVKVRFDRSANTFNQVASIVADGKADLGLSKLGRTLGRAQQVLYSVPYLSLRHGLLVNRAEFAKLAGNLSVAATTRAFLGSICVLSGTSWEEFARRYFPKATVIASPSWDGCLDQVLAGRITAAYRDEFEVRAVIKRKPSLALTARTIVLSDLETTLAIAVNRENPTLLGFVNQFIALRPEKLDVEAVLKEIQ